MLRIARRWLKWYFQKLNGPIMIPLQNPLQIITLCRCICFSTIRYFWLLTTPPRWKWVMSDNVSFWTNSMSIETSMRPKLSSWLNWTFYANNPRFLWNAEMLRSMARQYSWIKLHSFAHSKHYRRYSWYDEEDNEFCRLSSLHFGPKLLFNKRTVRTTQILF